jgi:LPS export ABC transporter permease LptG
MRPTGIRCFDPRRSSPVPPLEPPLSTPASRDPVNQGSLAPRAILYRSIARELFVPTSLALAVFTAVVLTRDLPAYTELVINRGAGAWRVAWIVGCQSLTLVAQMLPFAVLVGGLVGLGRLVADREILVLSALGLDPRRLIGPVAAFGGALACLALGLSLVVSPMAQRAMNRAVRELAEGNPFSSIAPDSVHRFGDWKIEAREVSGHGRTLGRVLLWMPSVGETIFSQTARLATSEDGKPEIELQNGLLLTNTRAKPRALRFESLRTRIPEPKPTADLPFEDHLKSASFSTLTDLARHAENEKRRLEAESELHRRFAFPVATLLLGILALPLAIGRRQTSRSSGALVGVALTIGYYGLVQVAEGLAQKRPELSALATWLPNAVLLGAIGLLFLGLAVPLAKRGARTATRASTRERAATEGEAREAGRTARLRVRRRALPRYVALRFLQLALFSLTVLVVAYLLVDVLERLQWFARHAARFEEIVHFYSARIPLLASRVTPMALVVAMAFTVSLLTSTGELLGMRTLGISSHRALLPALLLCGVATPLSFVLNDQIVPRTNELADMIKQSEIKQEKDERSDRTAIWGTHGRTLYQLERLDASRGAGRNIIVYELLANGLPTRRIDARRALHVGGGHWQLQDATGIAFEDPARLASIDPPAHVELGEEPSAERDLMYLSVVELFGLIREVASSGEPTTELEVDLHVKLATPLACLILPALVMMFASSGPPFPGSALTLILAGAIAVAYTLLAGAFASFGRGGVMPPWLGGWGPNLIGIVALVGLMGRDWMARRRA